MNVFRQLVGGGLISFLNFALHAAMTGCIVIATRHTANVTDHLGVFSRLFALLTVTMIALMCAHVAEIGIWTIYYAAVGVHTTTASYFEFAFENYTALGYGDAVPRTGLRLTGPITALNGLLLIGWSVAIIFEVMRMADFQFGRLRKTGRLTRPPPGGT
jgi:hypothetical protein